MSEVEREREKPPDGCAILRDLDAGTWIAVPNFIGGGKPIGRFPSREGAVEALWQYVGGRA